jgi:hypothetical protein
MLYFIDCTVEKMEIKSYENIIETQNSEIYAENHILNLDFNAY